MTVLSRVIMTFMCDRCGFQQEKTYYSSVIDRDDYPEGWTKLKILTFMDTNICPKCTESLRKWRHETTL